MVQGFPVIGVYDVKITVNRHCPVGFEGPNIVVLPITYLIRPEEQIFIIK